MRRPADPAHHLGVYKSLSDVPDRRRLDKFIDRYEGVNVWPEFVVVFDTERGGVSDRTLHKVERAGDRWTTFVSEETDDPHPALATPATVEAWYADLLTGVNPVTLYTDYASYLMGFYDLLVWSIDHPHTYSPTLLAAADPENTAARTAWNAKLTHAGRDPLPEFDTGTETETDRETETPQQ